jgi:small subunit ribosomal protein S1
MVETDADVVTRPSVEVVRDDGRTTDAGFPDLLRKYDYRSPRRGQILQGEVLKVHDDAVLVDVGVKRDAFVPRKDLERLDDTTLEQLEPGAEVKVYVLQPQSRKGDLIVSINKALEHEDWARADDLMHNGETVEAEVTSTNRGGVLVQFGRLQGFVPQSHLTSMPRGRYGSEEERKEVKERLIGRILVLKMIDVDRRRNRLVLSERAARRETRMARMAELERGQVLTGHVVSLQSYGAFVDVGGIDGLIHVSELAYRRVQHPGDVLSVGDEVEVLVKSVDIERERIGLSRKALLPSPWETIEEDYQVDDLATGEVTKVVDFGAFVALPNGLEGLVHMSRMSSYRVSHPGELVRSGDEVLVRITDIDTERERIALSLDAVSSEEQAQWMEARSEADLEENMPPDVDEGSDQSEPDNQPGDTRTRREDNNV